MQEQQISEWFDAFRAVYPKREGTTPRKLVWERFSKLMKLGIDPTIIIAGAKCYADEMERMKKIGTCFVKQASTWLNQRCWEDYSSAAQGRKAQPPLERTFVEVDTPAWLAAASKWRSQHPVGPPEHDFEIDGKFRRGWWFTREFTA